VLIQDTTAHAAALLRRAVAAGKKVAASTVAHFAVKLTRAGRRSTGSSATDVMHPGTQLGGRSRMVSFDEPLGMDDDGAGALTLADVLDNGQEDPSMLAARRLDWETLLNGQTQRGRMLLAVVAGGRALREAARLLGLSDSSAQEEKRKVARAVKEFMGNTILADCARQPMWRDNIMASKGKRAMRAARL
jgi:hypothetical protein